MGNDEILRRYVPEFEQGQILAEAHGGGGLQEDIMWDAPQHRRFSALDYGGQLYIKIQRCTVGLVMYVMRLGKHHGGMKCHLSQR